MFHKTIDLRKIIALLLCFVSVFSMTSCIVIPDFKQEDIPQRSLSETADILKQCGIGGISDEMIADLEKTYARFPGGNDTDRILALLFELGFGEMDDNSFDWSPSDNGVYAFDVEVFDMMSMYTNFLLGIQSLTGDEITISGIEEDHSEVDWEKGTGVIKVSFKINNNEHTVNAKVMNDWFDLNFANTVSDIIVSNDKKLWFTPDGGQGCIVFFRDEEWVKQFRKQTGIRLSRTIK